MTREIEKETQSSRDKSRKAKLSIEVADAVAELAAGRKQKPFFDFRHDKENFEIRMYKVFKRRDFSERPHRSKFVREFIGTVLDHIVHVQDLDLETQARLWSISPALPAYLQNWLEQVHVQNFVYIDRLACLFRLERELLVFATICGEADEFELIREHLQDHPDVPKHLKSLWDIIEQKLTKEKFLP